jgi:hypothetical protein
MFEHCQQFGAFTITTKTGSPEVKCYSLWHSSVVVFGREYTFNNQTRRLIRRRVDKTKKPTKVHVAGVTKFDQDQLEAYLDLMKAQHSKETCELFEKNCNYFTIDVCKFLKTDNFPETLKVQVGLTMYTCKKCGK